MGNTYLVLWKTGSTINEARGTESIFEALRLLFFHTPLQPYHWKALEIR